MYIFVLKYLYEIKHGKRLFLSVAISDPQFSLKLGLVNLHP